MANNVYREAEKKVYGFFYNIENNAPLVLNGVKLVDRVNQNELALDVIESIRDRDVLLIEAGVGIGKSFGYLIPIFYTIDNVAKFKQVVISTSTIALQEQLLNDISKVSKMLDIKINVETVKGINNYVCLKKINKLICIDTDSKKRLEYQKILNSMDRKMSADRSDLIEISNSVWNDVKANSRSGCKDCAFKRLCYYHQHLFDIKRMNDNDEKFILITNHAFLSYLLKEKPEVFNETDAFVIDEAHKLEEALRTVNPGSLIYREIKKSAVAVKVNSGLNTAGGIPDRLKDLYREIQKNIDGISKNDSRYNSDIVPFNYSEQVKKKLSTVISSMEKFIKSAKEKCPDIDKRTDEYKKLLMYYNLFCDMAKGISSKENIYWAVKEGNDRISLYYSPKKLGKVMNTMINKRNKASVILTSGTMSIGGDYQYFKEGLGLNDVDTNDEFPLPSPYDFDENVLLYYNPNMMAPNFDVDRGIDVVEKNEYYSNYLIELGREIDKLIRLSNGKSLVLFTSKNDMNTVYSHLSTAYEYPFELLIQGENNSDKVKEEFINNTNSVLFATGTFWEGVDIKGKSLSNLIICRLPFSNLDPILEGKASSYSSDDRFYRVYLNDMLIKLKQGIGRLIRSETDNGIVCVLDPRIDRYGGKILNELNLPYTTDYKKLEEFVCDKKIADDSSIHKSR